MTVFYQKQLDGWWRVWNEDKPEEGRIRGTESVAQIFANGWATGLCTSWQRLPDAEPEPPKPAHPPLPEDEALCDRWGLCALLRLDSHGCGAHVWCLRLPHAGHVRLGQDHNAPNRTLIASAAIAAWVEWDRGQGPYYAMALCTNSRDAIEAWLKWRGEED